MQSSEFYEGYEAFFRGDSEDQNPYPPTFGGSYGDWILGWQAAQHVAQHATF
jgi:hypothetical protein